MKNLLRPRGLLFATAVWAYLGCGGRASNPDPGAVGGDGPRPPGSGGTAGSGSTGSGASGGIDTADSDGGGARGADSGRTSTSGSGGTGAAGSGGAGNSGSAGTGAAGSGGTSAAGSGGSGAAGSGGSGAAGSGGTGAAGSGGAPADGGPGTGTYDARSDNAAECRPYSSPAICSQNPTGPVATPTLDAFRQAISQRWLLCGKQSVFSPNGPDIGLEITPDGHWYKLYNATGGSTIRGAGFDEEGTWDTYDVSDPVQPFQINLHVFGGGTIYTHPVLAQTPPAMRLNNNGVLVGNYVLDPSVPVGGTRCAPEPDPTRLGICTPPPETAVRSTCDDATAIAAVGGRWSRCGGLMPGAPPHDGVEFGADGAFYFLSSDGMGGLARGSADTHRGSVAVTAWQCRINTEIRTVSGLTLQSATKAFDSSPRQLWIATSPEWADPERYTFVGP